MREPVISFGASNTIESWQTSWRCKATLRVTFRKSCGRVCGADEQKLEKNYTANTEAYQLYLKGRYHLLKLTPPEIQTSVSYFNQAIEIDPSYAFAYVGLATAYRSLSSVSVEDELISTKE